MKDMRKDCQIKKIIVAKGFICSYKIKLYLKNIIKFCLRKANKIIKRVRNRSVKTTKVIHKDSLANLYKVALKVFLSGSAMIAFDQFENPLISIIIVVHNRAELTYQCLLSIKTTFDRSYEIIIFDNASSDKTMDLLQRVTGVKIINNNGNVHFLLAVNKAAKIANGKYLLLLNNDAQLLPGALDSALRIIESSDDIGAVGAKIMLLDGTLQEAGSIVWQDGSCTGYGRGDNPFNSEYMFQRDVDYCSAVFLLTKRNLFMENGGFDESFTPAYYEDTDYCLRLWKQGKRVVYNPDSSVLHFEFASSKSKKNALTIQKKHRDIFFKKHKQLLLDHFRADDKNILPARYANKSAKKILFIDDRIPHAYLGKGYPRSRDILISLLELNLLVTFYPLLYAEEEWSKVYLDIPKEIEVMVDYGMEELEKFLIERKNYFDTILVSRPHNMYYLKIILDKRPDLFKAVKIIYDAEAVFGLRDIEREKLKGKIISKELINHMLNEELELARGVDKIVAVSESERRLFNLNGFRDVCVLGHSIQVNPSSNSFKDRDNILFVGATDNIKSPNTDSVIWFVNEIFPIIKERLKVSIKFLIAGSITCNEIYKLSSNSIEVLGKVENLTDLYNNCRLFVAPTRFASGIPYKVHHAAAHGLPIVATSLIAGQLCWLNEKDILSADSAQHFAEQCVRLYSDEDLWYKLRINAIDRIKSECSRSSFLSSLKEIVL